MIKPQFETYRYVGEVGRLKSQSIVECRLPGSEINSILAVYAKAVPQEAVCQDKLVQYGGRVLLCVVYEDGNKKICRAERGAEFFHKSDGAFITPSCFAKVSLQTENVTWRREGSGLYVSVVVDADIAIFGAKQMEYLMGGEGVVVKKGKILVHKTICVSGTTEEEDEFDVDYVGDVLMHTERAVVHCVRAQNGQIEVEGEVNVNVCVLKENDDVCSYERLLPFKTSIPCEDAFGKVTAGARVTVTSAHLQADIDEEKGSSHVVISYTLSTECYLVVCDEITVALDGFSTSAEMGVKMENEGGMYLINQDKVVERVSGVGIISPMVEGEYMLKASVLPRAEITIKKGERGMEAEGAVFAELLFCNEEGMHRTATLTLPFLFPVEVSGDHVEADCMVCGLSVRRKKDGEMEAEAMVKASLRCYAERNWCYISGVELGEELPQSDSAFSVFMTKEGEELWQVAKRLSCVPEDLEKSNPHLEFPLKEGARIFVYRQIKE